MKIYADRANLAEIQNGLDLQGWLTRIIKLVLNEEWVPGYICSLLVLPSLNSGNLSVISCQLAP